jgi:hypothetical protein
VLIEIQNRDRFAVHVDIMGSVDALLRGFPLPPELRTRDERARSRSRKPRLRQRPDWSPKTPRRRGADASLSNRPRLCLFPRC